MVIILYSFCLLPGCLLFFCIVKAIGYNTRCLSFYNRMKCSSICLYFIRGKTHHATYFKVTHTLKYNLKLALNVLYKCLLLKETSITIFLWYHHWWTWILIFRYVGFFLPVPLISLFFCQTGNFQVKQVIMVGIFFCVVSGGISCKNYK